MRDDNQQYIVPNDVVADIEDILNHYQQMRGNDLYVRMQLFALAHQAKTTETKVRDLTAQLDERPSVLAPSAEECSELELKLMECSPIRVASSIYRDNRKKNRSADNLRVRWEPRRPSDYPHGELSTSSAEAEADEPTLYDSLNSLQDLLLTKPFTDIYQWSHVVRDSFSCLRHSLFELARVLEKKDYTGAEYERCAAEVESVYQGDDSPYRRGDQMAFGKWKRESLDVQGELHSLVSMHLRKLLDGDFLIPDKRHLPRDFRRIREKLAAFVDEEEITDKMLGKFHVLCNLVDYTGRRFVALKRAPLGKYLFNNRRTLPPDAIREFFSFLNICNLAYAEYDAAKAAEEEARKQAAAAAREAAAREANRIKLHAGPNAISPVGPITISSVGPNAIGSVESHGDAAATLRSFIKPYPDDITEEKPNTISSVGPNAIGSVELHGDGTATLRSFIKPYPDDITEEKPNAISSVGPNAISSVGPNAIGSVGLNGDAAATSRSFIKPYPSAAEAPKPAAGELPPEASSQGEAAGRQTFEAIPQECRQAIEKTLTRQMRLNDGRILNSRKQLQKAAQAIDCTKGAHLAMLMMVGKEVKAVKTGAQITDFVRTLIGLGEILPMDDNKLRKLTNGMSKKINGYMSDGKKYNKLPDSHQEWKPADRKIGNSIFEAFRQAAE